MVCQYPNIQPAELSSECRAITIKTRFDIFRAHPQLVATCKRSRHGGVISTESLSSLFCYNSQCCRFSSLDISHALLCRNVIFTGGIGNREFELLHQKHARQTSLSVDMLLNYNYLRLDCKLCELYAPVHGFCWKVRSISVISYD